MLDQGFEKVEQMKSNSINEKIVNLTIDDFCIYIYQLV